MPNNTSFLSANPPAQNNELFFKIFAGITIASIFLGLATELYFLAGIPAFIILAYLTIVDLRSVFYLLLFFLPLSIDVDLSNGFATDLPSEPLMVGLMLCYLVYVIKTPQSIRKSYTIHPITILLLVHLAWTFVTTITSESFFVSIKFFLAKTWYIVVFYFLAGKILKQEKDLKLFFRCIYISLFITILWVVIRHAGYGFSFEDVFRVLGPFYTNHVIYASILVLFLPFVWAAFRWQKRGSLKWWALFLSLILLIIAIQLSFTRAAILCIPVAIGAYYIIQWRLTKIVIGISCIVAILLISSLLTNNAYLDYAPNYEKTVSHSSFDNLIEATAKGEDISTMERVYRWVAAGNMIADKPTMGFGPGNFYNFYKSYTVNNFRTYVSDNPEKSGIHNYYLMVTVEQGMIGFLIFILFAFFVLIKGEYIYHQTEDSFKKRIVMAALMSIIIIDVLLLINDMIETDKIGTFYFLNIAILVNVDIENSKRKLLDT